MFVSTYVTKYGTLVRRCIMNARPIVLLINVHIILPIPIYTASTENL